MQGAELPFVLQNQWRRLQWRENPGQVSMRSTDSLHPPSVKCYSTFAPAAIYLLPNKQKNLLYTIRQWSISSWTSSADSFSVVHNMEYCIWSLMWDASEPLTHVGLQFLASRVAVIRPSIRAKMSEMRVPCNDKQSRNQSVLMRGRYRFDWLTCGLAVNSDGCLTSENAGYVWRR